MVTCDNGPSTWLHVVTKQSLERLLSEFCNERGGDLETDMPHRDHRSPCDKALKRVVKL